MKNKFNCFYLRIAAIITLSVFSGSYHLHAQSAKSSDYATNPAWVQMMSDPNVNYYAAEKAYNDYWAGREKPNNEEEEMKHKSQRNNSTKLTDKEKKQMEKQEREHQREVEREAKKKVTEKDLKELEWKREMTYQCKRFEDWKRTVKPFVQNDGRILTEEERMQIHQQREQEYKDTIKE